MPPEHHAKSEQVDRQSRGENPSQAETFWDHSREAQSVSGGWHILDIISGRYRRHERIGTNCGKEIAMYS